jgi:hypothetical protein
LVLMPMGKSNRDEFTEKTKLQIAKRAGWLCSDPSVELRQKLLAMTTDGGPTDAAARCLDLIDRTRDEHGRPEAEPRHPDLGSCNPWPIITRDPDAGEAV